MDDYIVLPLPTGGRTEELRALRWERVHLDGYPTHVRAAQTESAPDSRRLARLEEISRLVGHSGTTVTELVHRHQLEPVIQTGANVMDHLSGCKAERA